MPTLRYLETLPSTTLKWLARCNRDSRDGGNLFLLAGVGHHVSDVLEDTGLIDAIGRENVFPARERMMASIEAAMERAQQWLDRRPESGSSH